MTGGGDSAGQDGGEIGGKGMLQSLQSVINTNNCRNTATFVTSGLDCKFCCTFELSLSELS